MPLKGGHFKQFLQGKIYIFESGVLSFKRKINFENVWLVVRCLQTSSDYFDDCLPPLNKSLGLLFSLSLNIFIVAGQRFEWRTPDGKLLDIRHDKQTQIQKVILCSPIDEWIFQSSVNILMSFCTINHQYYVFIQKGFLDNLSLSPAQVSCQIFFTTFIILN